MQRSLHNTNNKHISKAQKIMMEGMYGLYWGNLAKSVNEEIITEMCVKTGVWPIYVKIYRDKLTQESLGNALILCTTLMDADKVTQMWNNCLVEGKAIRIMPYVSNFKETVDPKLCIVLYHLPPTMTQKDLFMLCSEFGYVLSCYLPTNSSGESTCTGFVMFASLTDKEIALSSLNNLILKEGTAPLKVYPYFCEEERIIHRYTKGTYNNLYVKGIPKENFTETDLRSIFGKYGELYSIVLKKDSADPSKNCGSAYVCFKENEAAVKAKEELHGKMIKGYKLHVDRHYKKAQMAALQSAKRKMEKEGWKMWYADCNVYVKPVPETVGKKSLEELFGKYGTIISTKIPRDQTNKPKPFAFVCFSKQKEAQSAIKALNGAKHWGKVLKVSLAHDKQSTTDKIMLNQFPHLGYFPYSLPMFPMIPPVNTINELEHPSATPIEQKEEENPYYLDKKFLRKATPEAKKQYLGEKLYMIVAEKEPHLASKITSTILEKSVEEIIQLFGETKISEKIAELKADFPISTSNPA